MKLPNRYLVELVAILVGFSAVVAAILVLTLAAGWGSGHRPPISLNEAISKFPAYFAVILAVALFSLWLGDRGR